MNYDNMQVQSNEKLKSFSFLPFHCIHDPFYLWTLLNDKNNSFAVKLGLLSHYL
jgi:hypothetical protein